MGDELGCTCYTNCECDAISSLRKTEWWFRILSVCKIRDQIVGFHNATRLTTLRDSAMPKISYVRARSVPPPPSFFYVKPNIANEAHQQPARPSLTARVFARHIIFFLVGCSSPCPYAWCTTPWSSAPSTIVRRRAGAVFALRSSPRHLHGFPSHSSCPARSC